MRKRQLAATGLVAGLGLHTAAALWVWRGWAAGSRTAWLVWMDFPLSLAWLEAPAPRVLALSLAVGGLFWGAVSAALVLLVGRLARRR